MILFATELFNYQRRSDSPNNRANIVYLFAQGGNPSRHVEGPFCHIAMAREREGK